MTSGRDKGLKGSYPLKANSEWVSVARLWDKDLLGKNHEAASILSTGRANPSLSKDGVIPL